MRPRLPAWTATLTFKTACFIVVMCCALAAVLGALVHVEVTRQTVETAREKALGRLAEASLLYEEGEALPPDSGIDPPGLPPSLRALALSGQRGTMVGDHGGRAAMWAAAPADGKALATAVDYTQSASTISGLDNAIIGSSVLAIGGTLLLGAFAVTRVTRRLHMTAAVARRITQGDLDARVGDPRTKGPARRQDEVATVAGALDTMASTLQAKLVREQRFTADVAHELRTPLTGLQAASELLPEGRPTQMVQERVRTMRQLTEDLLEISRLDAGSERVEAELQRLGRLAERVVRASGTATEVVVVRDVYVETDRRRLERVLGNLVANAHKHGAGPVVLTVDVSEGGQPVVTVRDHGAGYPEYLVREGPQRFRTEPRAGAAGGAGGAGGVGAAGGAGGVGGTGAGTGTGLGLTIAVGQAAVLGARLVFRNAEGGGAVAELTLPVPAEPVGPEGPAESAGSGRAETGRGPGGPG